MIGGTSGSPTATPNNTEIISFGGAGTGDGTTITGRRAAYSIKATETWTSTANGSALLFKTTANGSTGSSDRGMWDQDGKLLVGTTTNNGNGNHQVSGGLELVNDTLNAPVTNTPISIVSGKQFVTTGSNKSAGTTTLSSGTVTVNTTAVSANSIIFVTGQGCTNCGTYYISAKTAGTSFVITSSNASDASTVAWWIIN